MSNSLGVPSGQGWRAFWACVAFLAVGVVGCLIVYNAPVIGLDETVKPEDAVTVVRGRTALYLALLAALTAVIDVVVMFVWDSTPKRDFWVKLVSIFGAVAGLVAGILGIPVLTQMTF